MAAVVDIAIDPIGWKLEAGAAARSLAILDLVWRDVSQPSLAATDSK